MKTIISDVIMFVRKFWTIIWTWIQETIAKHKFKNTLMILIAIYFWFVFSGKFSNFIGTAVFFTWIGMNVEAIMNVYRELKVKNNW